MGQGNGSTAIVPQAGGSVRQDFAGVESTALAETASSAVAAQARAAVESRYVLAMRRPRDLDEVRVRLLKECARPGFAACAIYRKPVGQGVEGPSIRFAEAALRCLGNVLPEVSVVYDDTAKRIVRVSVTDLEANLTYSQDVVIEKTVERSKVRDSQQVIGKRLNSYGKDVFLVPATEDDLLMKSGALVSKALRTLALRILPGDLLDEAMAKIRATRQNDAAKDPEAARKALVDAFSAVGVMPGDLKIYLGHDLGASSPAEMEELRGVYAALREGESTWADLIEAKQPAKAPTADGAAPVAGPPPKGAAGAKAKLATTKSTPPPAAPPPRPEPTMRVFSETKGMRIEVEDDPNDPRYAPPDDVFGDEPGSSG